MLMQPQRVLMSRDGSDANHQPMHDVRAVLPADPSVGETMQLWTEDGQMIRTSIVRKVERKADEIVVDTLNSRYHLHLSN